METFDEIYILDLHGSSKKKETAPDGSKDENIFDIQQGVAIGILVKKPNKAKTDKSKIYHAELWGDRERKYETLLLGNIATVKWNNLLNVERETCLGTFRFFAPIQVNRSCLTERPAA